MITPNNTLVTQIARMELIRWMNQEIWRKDIQVSQWKSRLMQWRLSQMVYVNNARSGSCWYCRLLSCPESDNNDLTPAGSLQTASKRAGMRPLFAQRHSGTTNKDKSGFGPAWRGGRRLSLTLSWPDKDGRSRTVD